MRECAKCDNTLQLMEAPAAPGEQGGLRVTFSGMLLPTCPAHGPQPETTTIGLPMELLFHVVREKALPLADRRGFLRKRYHCRQCQAVLDLAGRATARVESRIAWKESPSITIAIEGPVARCPQCGTSQLLLDPQGVRDVSQAMIEALKNMGLMT